MSYKPEWDSLKDHVTPKWFKNAKFGIYTHWGVYSVPACGPNGTWYPYNMYREGTTQYDYHVKNFGHPSKFGYKDFIPMFTGEEFDPYEWADLFKKAGAQFAGPVAEHHDGFTMWDTKLNKWNSVIMGPKRDVVGELEKSIRSKGMHYMVALHHAENWFFFPHWKKEYDVSDRRYAGLYGGVHNTGWADGYPVVNNRNEEWALQDKPDKEFLDLWLAKINEIVDRYRPDLLWFDFGLAYIQEHYKREFLSNYYNRADEWGRDVVVTYKRHDLAAGCGVIDLELGRFNTLTYHDWITDTTVDSGKGWGYLTETEYKSAETLVHYLIDNVSKNGSLLLNVGPKPNGRIPEEVQDILLDMGRWLDVNGEAIYETTPWLLYGEGPTQMTASGMKSEQVEEIRFRAEDIRFTVKGDTLYAICLGWPGEELVIKSIPERLYESEIKSVKLLGVEGDLQWKLEREGMRIKTPDCKPCKFAYSFKIERRHP